MTKIVITLMCMSFVLATTLAAPTSEPKILRPEIKTPASTSKLTPVVTPIVAAPIAHIPYAATAIVSHVSPYGYAYAAPVPPAVAAYVPGSYSIEQHGYNIAY